MTNREYMINLLLDGIDKEDFERVHIDDGGASEEAMIYYNVNCPYYDGDKRCHCIGDGNQDRDTCVACKAEWLDSEVDE